METQTQPKFDLYSNPQYDFIPDVEITKIEGSWLSGDEGAWRKIWFTWRGAEQLAKMVVDEDGYWIIDYTKYTDEFDEWLDENLDNYDSLESMFDLPINAHYSITYGDDN